MMMIGLTMHVHKYHRFLWGRHRLNDACLILCLALSAHLLDLTRKQKNVEKSKLVQIFPSTGVTGQCVPVLMATDQMQVLGHKIFQTVPMDYK